MIVGKSPETTEIIKKIKSKGYWRIEVAPKKFKSDRIVDVSTLATVLDRCRVSIRGWDFPHMDPGISPALHGNWIRHEVDFGGVVESWCFFQSGQLLQLKAERSDWRHESSFSDVSRNASQKVLELYDAIYTVTEVYEFAARLTNLLVDVEETSISIHLFGTENRQLVMHPSAHRAFMATYTARVPEIEWRTTMQRQDILGNARELAQGAVVEIFKQFQWNDCVNSVKSIQGEFRS